MHIVLLLLSIVIADEEKLLKRIEIVEQEILDKERRIRELVGKTAKTAKTAKTNSKNSKVSFADGDFYPTLPSCEADADPNLTQMWTDSCKLAEVLSCLLEGYAPIK